MKSLKNNQESPSNLKEQILCTFSVVAGLLKKNNFTEALATITSHFTAHLDYAFDVAGSKRAPLFFVDSIVSEYFLYRPYPDSPEKASLIKPENYRDLQLTSALIIRELTVQNIINTTESETLNRPEVLQAISAARSRL